MAASLKFNPMKVRCGTGSGTGSGTEPAKPAPNSGGGLIPGILSGATRAVVSPLTPGVKPKLGAITSGYPEGIPVIFPNNSTPYQNPTFTDTPWPNWKEATYFNRPRKSDAEIEYLCESELIHGRWAMLGVAGAWGAEVGTGVPWFKAGALCTPSDCTALNTIFPGQVIPLVPGGEDAGPGFWTVVAIEIAIFGTVESYRAGWNKCETPNQPWKADNVKTWENYSVGDLHPGGVHFDPLNLGEKFDLDDMKVAELKHARLAMFSWLGFMAQAFQTNGCSLGPKYPHEVDGAIGPFANWQQHIADPTHENVVKYIFGDWNKQFLGIFPSP